MIIIIMGRPSNIDIICLTGGKCGSSTLRRTFLRSGFNTIKCHSKSCFKSQFGYDGLIDLIDTSCLNKKVYLIDSYRTPMERKISSFFQNIRTTVPDYRSRSFEELNEIFINGPMKGIEEYESIDDIMDNYDVEKFTEFDFEKRYVMKEKGNIVFIKILYSDIKEWDKILSDIFNKEISIVGDNVSCNKGYFNKYNEFKKNFKIPIGYIDEIKSKESFQIFNTKEEQDIYINKWKNKSF